MGGSTFGSLVVKWLIGVVLAVILIAIVAGGFWMWHKNSNDNADTSSINKGEYQALFLTNGQVYFGKLTQPDGQYVKLTDIYYLQTQAAQPSTSGNSSAAASAQQLSLAKLGNELHGPEDAMYVAKPQVLFWENLKSSGKVVQAIQQYQAQNKK